MDNIFINIFQNTVPFKVFFFIRSTTEIVLRLNEFNYKKAKIKGCLSTMTNDYRE